MKMKVSKLPFITFLKKKHQVYLLHCICDLAPYKFENILGTKHQIEGTVRHATLIRLKRLAYGNGNIRTQSYFLVRTTFSPYKKSRSLALRTNKIPLCESSFVKGRKHCGKRRKCWLLAFSPVPIMFSKGFSVGVVKSRDCVGKV